MPTSRLMVMGLLQQVGAPGCVELRRGMVVLDATGKPLGPVAGVLVDSQSGRVSHLVLSRDIVVGDYRVVQANQITLLDVESVRLCLSAADAADLPQHEPY